MPPVQVDYTPKGSDITVQGMKTCEPVQSSPSLSPTCSDRSCRQDGLIRCYNCHPTDWRCLWQRTSDPSGEIDIFLSNHFPALTTLNLPFFLSKYRAPISSPLVATAHLSTESSFLTSYRDSMPATLGFLLTQKRSNRQSAPTSAAMRISARRRGKFRRSSKRSNKRPMAKSPSGQLLDFAGVEK